MEWSPGLITLKDWIYSKQTRSYARWQSWNYASVSHHSDDMNSSEGAEETVWYLCAPAILPLADKWYEVVKRSCPNNTLWKVIIGVNPKEYLTKYTGFNTRFSYYKWFGKKKKIKTYIHMCIQRTCVDNEKHDNFIK